MRTPLSTLAWGLSAGLSLVAQSASAPSVDPYQWLEDVTGEKPLAWVKARNAESEKELAASTAFQQLEGDLRKILDSKDRIPYVSKEGAYYYNFWRDGQNPRGLWRRTTLEEYRKANPAWEVVLDLDALGKAEGENWVWHGAQFLRPGFKRCLIALSRGGADASVTREFDMDSKSFVKDGFQLPEAKGSLAWIDQDTVFVQTDFGAGSMTTSGYPRLAKLWKRGAPLADAKLVYEGKEADLSISAFHDDAKGFERDFVHRGIAFYRSELFLRKADGTLQKVDVPIDAIASAHHAWLTIQPRTPWTVGGKTYPGGSLLVTRFDDFMAGKRDLTVVFEPTAHVSLASHAWTKEHLVLNLLEDVKNRLVVLTPTASGWDRKPLSGAPGFATVGFSPVDSDESEDYFLTQTDYLTPASLHLGTLGKGQEQLKQAPAFFDATGLEITQHFATSKDGTKVPYFQVAKKGLKLDGANPTLLYGYGGFEVSLTPNYNAAVGKAWLSQGGVYLLANIRGGGEYGPQWHQAALRQNRLRAYEDFAAVAQDAIARKITSPKHLGTMGGSNGGLLMGNMTTLYPQLFGAVVCQVPLLDMKRYNHLLAGASWMAEYGDPDKPEDWAFIQTFSPYQNVKKEGHYPPVLFTTSTRDDRVHPGHARKMMAKMQEMGHDVRYYENVEGGHGGSANNQQAAHMQALAYTFLWQKLR